MLYKEENTHISLKNKIAAVVGLGIIFIVIFVFSEVKENERKEIINHSHGLTVGNFLRIGQAGSSGGKYLVCYYFVDGAKYEQTCEGFVYDNECYSRSSLCDSMKFNILYSVNNPSKSLIKPVWNGFFVKDKLPNIDYSEYKN